MDIKLQNTLKVGLGYKEDSHIGKDLRIRWEFILERKVINFLVIL